MLFIVQVRAEYHVKGRQKQQNGKVTSPDNIYIWFKLLRFCTSSPFKGKNLLLTYTSQPALFVSKVEEIKVFGMYFCFSNFEIYFDKKKEMFFQVSNLSDYISPSLPLIGKSHNNSCGQNFPLGVPVFAYWPQRYFQLPK